MLENHMITGLQHDEACPDIQECEYCKGTGIDPIGYDGEACPVCDGEKTVVVPPKPWRKRKRRKRVRRKE